MKETDPALEPFLLRKPSEFPVEIHIITGCNLYSRVKRWAEAGAFWGAVWGFLAGCSLFMVPGNGPLIVCIGGAVFAGGLSGAVGFISSDSLFERPFLPEAKTPIAGHREHDSDRAFFKNFLSDEERLTSKAE